MKRIISILMLGILFFGVVPPASAQSNALRSFSKKYRILNGVKNFRVGGWLIRLGMGAVDQPLAESLRPIANSLDMVRILVFDEKVKPTAEDIKTLVAGLRTEKFEDLMNIRDGKSRVNMMIRTNKSGTKIYDMVIIVKDGDDGEAVVLGIEGEFKMADIQKMMEKGELTFNMKQ
jgi:hypothetical protein